MAPPADSGSPRFVGSLPDAGEVRGIAFSPDGQLVATAGGNSHTVSLWNAGTGELVRMMAGHAVVDDVAFSPDGKLTATGGRDIVQLRDAAHGGHIRDITGNTLLAFSPEGNLLTADRNGALSLCDPITGTMIHALTGAYAKAAAFSPDGERIAVITPNNVAALISG
jgi:WD40 repeat protein